MQSVSFILIIYVSMVNKKKDTPIVYYNYIEELIETVLHHRNQEPNDIKLGVDGDRDSLKFLYQSP